MQNENKKVNLYVITMKGNDTLSKNINWDLRKEAYVIANDPTEAQNKVEKYFNEVLDNHKTIIWKLYTIELLAESGNCLLSDPLLLV